MLESILAWILGFVDQALDLGNRAVAVVLDCAWSVWQRIITKIRILCDFLGELLGRAWLAFRMLVAVVIVVCVPFLWFFVGVAAVATATVSWQRWFGLLVSTVAVLVMVAFLIWPIGRAVVRGEFADQQVGWTSPRVVVLMVCGVLDVAAVVFAMIVMAARSVL